MIKKLRNKKYIITPLKASFTVEASAVMFLLLFTIVGTIYLCLFIHNRSWLTAAAYESAVSGSMEQSSEESEIYLKTREKAQELIDSGLYGSENLETVVQTGKTIEVYYKQDTRVEFGGLLWHLQAHGSAKMIKPVAWIRKRKAASDERSWSK